MDSWRSAAAPTFFAERDVAFAEQIGFHLSQVSANLTLEKIHALREQVETAILPCVPGSRDM